MKIDFSKRQSGKTTKIVEWVRDNPNRVLITFNYQRANQLRNQFPDIRDRIFSWREYTISKQIWRRDEIGIDDLDMVLREQLNGKEIGYLTINDESNDI